MFDLHTIEKTLKLKLMRVYTFDVFNSTYPKLLEVIKNG